MDAALASETLREKPYAGVFVRIGAYVIDCLILFVGLIVWQAALYVINPLLPIIRSGQQPTGSQFHLWVFATVTIPFLLYFALIIRSARRATLGMRLLKLRVATRSGGCVGLGQAMLRSAVMLIPFELNHAVMFYLAPGDASPSAGFWLGSVGVWAVIAIYIVSILVTRRHQSVHDLVADTVVEREG
jgi:uncharacterized RDD family membrane protein YckC